MIALLALAAASAADCPERPSAAALTQQISQGEAAYVQMDETAFREAHARVAALLPCVKDPLGSTQALALHRMEALYAFLERDEPGAVGSLRAVLAIAPAYQLPESLAPAGHPLQAHYAKAAATPASLREPLPLPSEGTVWIDGAPGAAAPLDRPFLFQYVDGEGRAVATERVPAGRKAPRYPVRREERGVNVPLLAGAGVAAVAAGGAWYAARDREDAFWDPATDPGDLPGLQRQANTLSALSVGATALAAGAGVAAVLVGTW